MERIYISGPITGYINGNREAFYSAQTKLEEDYSYVANPFEICFNLENPTYGDFMRVDIRALTYCDAIYMLKGWEESKGANIEFLVAEAMGLKIIYE